MRDPTDAIREEAARWVVRLRESGGTAERAAFEEWTARSPAHAAAFADVRALFGTLETPTRMIAERDKSRPSVARDFDRRGSGRPWLLAASLVLCALLGFWQRERILDLGSDAVTAAGETASVRLPDGSTVALNTRTAIKAMSDSETRGVRLIHGEAYLEVAKDPLRPFVVEAGDARVRVLGTRFNVRMDDDRVVVSVDEGHVLLSSARDATHQLALTAGQEGFATPLALQRRPGTDARDASAWRDGKVMFFETPLASVVSELNRYRKVPILVLGVQIRDRRISGVFNLSDTGRTIETIEQSLEVQALHLPTGLTVIY